MEKENLQTIDAYIDNCPEEIRNRLQELRRIIREVEPTMTEKIAWQMPSFYLNGPIIHFATNKKHIGIDNVICRNVIVKIYCHFIPL